MGAFLFYLIKSGLCLVLLYLSFRFLMSRTTFFRLNRLILVVGMACCALLPLVELTTEKQLLYNPLQSVRYLLDDVLFSHPLLPSGDELSVDGSDGTSPLRSGAMGEESSMRDGNQLLPLLISSVYLMGGAGVFLWIVVSTFRMWCLIRGAEKRIVGKYRLIVTSQPICSFSWGRYIVLSEADYTQHADEIVKHEMMHLRNHHTFDLLFLQLFLVLHWFNPVIWLLKRELQEIHEYEADNGVINTGIDATRYQLLLVKKAVGTRLYSMANGFNHSKLKNRITMMLKERTNRWARLKLLLFVPVVAGTLYAFAQPEVKEVLQQVTPQVPQNAEDDYLSLMNFFKKEEEAYNYRTWGKPVSDRIKEKQVHMLLVNTKNQILFDNVYAKVETLKPLIVKHLLKSWEASGKKDAQIVVLQFDRGANSDALTEILKQVKSAYEQIRTDLSADSADKSKEYLDKLFPIRLSEASPKNYGSKNPLPQEERISDVVITLCTSEGMETVENFTLDELEKKVVAARTKMPNPEDFVVAMKVDKNCKMGTVTDVKQVLRKASALKVNFSTEQEKSTK